MRLKFPKAHLDAWGRETGFHLNVWEVGVGDEFTSKSRAFWSNEANQVTLFEPNPFLYASLARKTTPYRNVKLYNVAISNENRFGHLVSAGLLSYLPEFPSPINTIFREKLTPMLDILKVPVNIMTFDQFDNGCIEMLILGMEGAESTVFETMRSRPHVIILNNHYANDYGYTFPRIEVIQHWCKDNQYQILQGVPDIMLLNQASLMNGLIAMI